MENIKTAVTTADVQILAILYASSSARSKKQAGNSRARIPPPTNEKIINTEKTK